MEGKRKENLETRQYTYMEDEKNLTDTKKEGKIMRELCNIIKRLEQRRRK
jgi:hypothetical protein